MSSEQQGTAVMQPAQPAAPKKALWICIAIAWLLFIMPIPGTVFLAGPVNIAAFILAIVCIVRQAVGTGIIGLACTIIGSPIAYFIGAALTVALFAAPA